LLHHHDHHAHDKPMTEAERARLLSEGAVTGALPELRRAGRPGEGVPRSRSDVPVLPSAGTGEPGRLTVG
jgi:hypothetical protein